MGVRHGNFIVESQSGDEIIEHLFPCAVLIPWAETCVGLSPQPLPLLLIAIVVDSHIDHQMLSILSPNQLPHCNQWSSMALIN